ncbi:MAG TPA: ATP-binding cassette domain-containing protein [Rhodocyclaceae bacterium]
MSFVLQGVDLVHANGHQALRGVSLAAAAGERIALIGPSGAGKTTLLRLLGAALRPTAGELSLLDIAPWSLDTAALTALRRRLGTVHQAAPIPPRQRVITAVLAGRLGRWPLWKGLLSLLYPLDPEGARAALAPLGLAERLFERCDRLSGGQLQRVGIARVLYQAPELILADEPVSALDPAQALSTVRLLAAEARDRGATLVASLHAVDLALACFPRIVGIKAGRIAFDLPASEVSEAMLHELYAAEGEALPTLATEPCFVARAAANDPASRAACC